MPSTVIEEEKQQNEVKKDKKYRLIEVESDSEPEGIRRKVIFNPSNKKRRRRRR